MTPFYGSYASHSIFFFLSLHLLTLFRLRRLRRECETCMQKCVILFADKAYPMAVLAFPFIGGDAVEPGRLQQIRAQRASINYAFTWFTWARLAVVAVCACGCVRRTVWLHAIDSYHFACHQFNRVTDFTTSQHTLIPFLSLPVPLLPKRPLALARYFVNMPSFLASHRRLMQATNRTQKVSQTAKLFGFMQFIRKYLHVWPEQVVHTSRCHRNAIIMRFANHISGRPSNRGQCGRARTQMGRRNDAQIS